MTGHCARASVTGQGLLFFGPVAFVITPGLTAADVWADKTGMNAKPVGNSIFSGALSAIFAFGRSMGFSIDEMASAAGVAPQDIVDPNKRVPDVSAQRLWTYISENRDDPAIAVKLATGAPVAVFGGLAEGVIYAATLREALGHFQTNMSLIGDRVGLHIDENVDDVTVSVSHPMDDADNGQMSVVGLLLLKRLISDVLGKSDAILGARLRTRPGQDPSAFRAFFRSNVQMGQTVNALRLSRAAFESPINHANAELFAFVQTHFLQKRESLQHAIDAGGVERLRRIIAENSLTSDYSLGSAASRANMSLRSAQRVAAQEGTTLQSLVAEVRVQNAKAMLAKPRLSVGNIADALGYSDDRSFRRAFKRHVGISPSEYRSSKAL